MVRRASRRPEIEAEGSPLRKPRNITRSTSLLLYVHAGGRCEFDGCNKYLLEHYPTAIPGNFAQQAHIYAFEEHGPRGAEAGRPQEINDLSNLMLLCPECHHLVDTERDRYPVFVLRRFKKDHEDRIYDLTDISKDRDSIPLVFLALVSGRPPDISDEEMQTAAAPDYLRLRRKVVIDLRSIPDTHNGSYWESAARAIDRKIAQLHDQAPRPGRALRVSVFALAPIPSLVYLGAKLSDKVVVDLYQRHRAPESWRWSDGVGKAHYNTRRLVHGPADGPVVLLINLSGENGVPEIPVDVGDGKSVYELTLKDQRPSPLFLNTRCDLERFTVQYLQALASIRNEHPHADVIHLFPAVPAPVAVILGRSRLPKVDPKLIVYDRDARAGGFVRTMEVA